jgi:hypothetical protein
MSHEHTHARAHVQANAQTHHTRARARTDARAHERARSLPRSVHPPTPIQQHMLVQLVPGPLIPGSMFAHASTRGVASTFQERSPTTSCAPPPARRRSRAGKDHDPNQSDGRLNEPGGTGPRRDRQPEAAQHCPRLGRSRDDRVAQLGEVFAKWVPATGRRKENFTDSEFCCMKKIEDGHGRMPIGLQ